MSAHPQEQERVRIGELSRRTGVQADTIRAWERRYGLVEPRRTSKGYRLYSSADEEVVRAMRELTAKGVAAAEAAALARRSAEAPPASLGALDPAAQAHRLRRALEAFDEEEANAILDECLAGLSLAKILDDIVPAAMAEIGQPLAGRRGDRRSGALRLQRRPRPPARPGSRMGRRRRPARAPGMPARRAPRPRLDRLRALVAPAWLADRLSRRRHAA